VAGFGEGEMGLGDMGTLVWATIKWLLMHKMTASHMAMLENAQRMPTCLVLFTAILHKGHECTVQPTG
jgi:hypothetical protein